MTVHSGLIFGKTLQFKEQNNKKKKLSNISFSIFDCTNKIFCSNYHVTHIRFPKHGYHLFRKAFHPKKLDFQNMDTICSEKHFIQKLGAVYIRMHIQMKSKFRCNVYHHGFLHLTMQFWEYKRGSPTRLSQYVFKPGVFIQDEPNNSCDRIPWWFCVSCFLLQKFVKCFLMHDLPFSQ